MKKFTALLLFLAIAATIYSFRSGPAEIPAVKTFATFDERYEDWPGQYRRTLRFLRAGSQDPVWKTVPVDVGADSDIDETAVQDGQVLAASHCSQCHALPTPDLLTKKEWGTWLQQKAAMLEDAGALAAPVDPTFQDLDLQLEGQGDRRRLRISQSLRENPLPRSAFAKIMYSFIASGPKTQVEAGVKAATDVPFKVLAWQPEGEFRKRDYGSVTIDAPAKTFFLGDQTGFVEEHSGSGNLRQEWRVSRGVTHIAPRGKQLFLTGMGSTYAPGYRQEGRLLELPRTPGARETVIVENLYRPVRTLFVPLPGDAVAFLVPEFGYDAGSLSLFTPSKGGFQKQELVTLPGIAGVELGDLDGDGHLDIVSLSSQGDEGIDFLQGTEVGGFAAPRRVKRFPPTYGSNSLRTADLDGDGRVEFITTHGDNMDLYGEPYKPYHGVRIFSGEPARGELKEAAFIPMPGAIQTIPLDFDGDGDIDLAAIANFPRNTSPQTFLFLENKGTLQFVPHALASVSSIPWIAMASGDIDQDGDADLVLCRMFGSKDVPKWVVLENQSRAP